MESGSGGVATGGSGTANIEISKTDTDGVIGTYYDQAAQDILATGFNYKLGVYDESGGNPTNLLGGTAEHAAAIGYAFKAVTEFALTTIGVWIAHIQDATSSQHYQTGFSSGATKYKTNTYSNGLPNTVGGGLTNDTYKFVQKVGHS